MRRNVRRQRRPELPHFSNFQTRPVERWQSIMEVG
jgi:hypothetical protein